MSSETIERVLELLIGAGYQRLTKPLEVSSVRFDFSATLVGGKRVPDLVVVLDTSVESESRIRQKLEGLARALDVAESRRPLTAILVGRRISASSFQRISRVCRVLAIADKSETNVEAQIQKSLAVLLPLELPLPTGAIVDPFQELSNQVVSPVDDPRAKDLIDAAKTASSAEVTDRLRRLIENPLLSIDVKHER